MERLLYTVAEENKDEIIFKPFICDFKYEIKELKDGSIIYKKIKEILVKTENDILKYHFRFSKLVECYINGKLINIKTYRKLLIYIYKLIGDGVRIIKNTTENIKIGKYTEKGFNYIHDLGISFHGNDSKKTLKEILHQCFLNNIKIECKIKLN